MKLTIWQQFSSNHSNSFDIVAQFESAEWAEQIRQVITETLLDYYDWDARSRLDSDIIDLKNDYELNGFHLDLTWILNRQHAQRAVYVVDNLLFITDEPGYAKYSTSGYNLVHLIKDLGGKISITLEDVPSTVVSVQADVSSHETIKEIRTLFEGKNKLSLNIGRFRPEDFFVTGKTILFRNIRFEVDRLYSLVRFLKHYDATNIQARFEVEEDPEQLHNGAVIQDWISLDKIDANRADWYKAHGWYRKNALIVTFESQQHAEQIADDIRHMVSTVAQWMVENPSHAEAIWRQYWIKLSPPEQHFKEMYNLDWDYSIIEWVYEAQKQDRLFDWITVLDTHLILHNMRETWVGIRPFDEFARRQGISAVDAQQGSYHICFDITITAPDIPTLSAIYELINDNPKNRIPPWLRYYNGTEQSESFMREAQEALNYELDHNELCQDFLSKHSVFNSTTEIERKAQVAALEFIRDHPPITRTSHYPMWLKLQEVIMTYHEVADQQNTTLKLEAIKFGRSTTFQGIAAIVTWLRASGCDITYEFRKCHSSAFHKGKMSLSLD